MPGAISTGEKSSAGGGDPKQHLCSTPPEGSRAPTGNRTAKSGEGKDRKIGHLHENNDVGSR
eukprot:scaffold1120_cov272-Pavlova_lutheri.AAC.1